MSQILDGIPLSELAEHHLDALRSLRVAEGPRLEFKADLKLKTGAEKREFCKDVSALANSQGGYILFGVAESNGVVDGVPGVEFGDTEQQQLMQVATSGIAPRVQNIEQTVIALRNNKAVLVLRIEPDGYLHQVKYDDNRYYKRTGTITIAMESSDVETFFTSKGPGNRNEEVEQLVSEYHAALRSKRYFRGVSGKGVCALTIVPEVASYRIDFSNLPRDINVLFRPVYCSGWDSEITGRARFTFGRLREEKTPYAVTEITEFGELKAFNSLLLEPYGRQPLPENVSGYVPSIAYERELISATHDYLSSFVEIGVSPPFFVNVGLLSVRGYIMYVDPIRFSEFGRVLKQDDVLPSSVKFASESQFRDRDSVANTMRPAFDFIWREFGFDRCFNFDTDGHWAPDR